MAALPRHQIVTWDDVIDDVVMTSLSHDDVIYGVIGIHRWPAEDMIPPGRRQPNAVSARDVGVPDQQKCAHPPRREDARTRLAGKENEPAAEVPGGLPTKWHRNVEVRRRPTRPAEAPCENVSRASPR